MVNRENMILLFIISVVKCQYETYYGVYKDHPVLMPPVTNQHGDYNC